MDRLKEEMMARNGARPGNLNPFIRCVALWRASKAQRSRVQVRAAYLHEIVKLTPISIEPEWRLAGNHLPTVCQPTRAPDFKNREEVLLLGELGVAPDEIPGVRAVAERSTKCRAFVLDPWYAAGELSPEAQRGRGRDGEPESTVVFTASGWVENHSIRDYAKVLRIGFRGVQREIESEMERADLAAADFPRKENFWRAGMNVCEAGVLLGRRYADDAMRFSDAAESPEERARLRAIADACARVPAEGARTFAEAVQSLWLAHILTCGEDGINANSLGRLDQILWTYYNADIKAGRLSREDAVDIMEELACRLYLHYDVQAITLGGMNANGEDAVNDLSYVILEATRNVGVIRDLSIRLHRGSPEPFIRLAAELMARGGGIPFIFNDECFIPALSERGIDLADARGYAPIGCIELTVPGRANPHAVSGWFNALKCLELALFDGRDHRTGTQIGPRTGTLEAFETFDDFFSAYGRQVETFAKRMVYCCNHGELRQREGGPLPCWSVLTDDCIVRGRDITDGGAIYNYHSICFMGVPNVADSMTALKRLVFEEERVGRAELLAALRGNFEGHEALRRMLLNEAPKYGNDVRETDELGRKVADHFIDIMDRMESPLGGRYFVHLFTFRVNIGFGKQVGATPDGRFADEPLAYSLSAHQGRDVNGVTAALSSIARMPHRRAAGASAAIVDLDPAMVEGPAGVERLTHLIRSAMEMGIGQLQWNVTTVERLKQAQADPERYGNIAVRVAGYSQMFKFIDKPMQDHIIARTKHLK